MEENIVHDAVALLEKANANLEPELLAAETARQLLAEYARAKKLASFGEALLAAKIDDATEVARASGTSIGKAKATVETAKALSDAPEVSDAFASGAISLDQATEIAKAEQASPGSAPRSPPPKGPVPSRVGAGATRGRPRRIIQRAQRQSPQDQARSRTG